MACRLCRYPGTLFAVALVLLLALTASSPTIASAQSTETTCNGTGVGTPYVKLYQANVTGLTATIGGYAVAGIVVNLTWSWGDGKIITGYFPQSHTYSSAGTYEVNVTIFDCTGGGKTGSASEIVEVGVSSTSSSSFSTAVKGHASNFLQLYVETAIAVGIVIVILLTAALYTRKSRAFVSKLAGERAEMTSRSGVAHLSRCLPSVGPRYLDVPKGLGLG